KKNIINVGMVGVSPGEGWASQTHIPALKSLKEYELKGIANSSLSSSKKAAEVFNVSKAYSSPEELCVDPDIDLVTVTVKVPHHKELVDKALDAGKMVYCEWPLGNGLDEAEAMAAKAQKLGIKAVTGLQARSSPVLRYVRDLIRDGYIGQVLSTTLVGSAGSNGAVSTERNAYLYENKNGANAFTIAFGHTIDALCWILGEFREVSATLKVRRDSFMVKETSEVRPNDTFDQIAVSGVLSDGIVVSAHYRGGLSRGTNLLWEINGTEGDLQITAPVGHIQLAELILRGGRGDDSTLSVMAIPDKYRTVSSELQGPAVSIAEAYARFSHHGENKEPLPDFEDAVKTHRLLDAIERSSLTGKKINL
ncbi:TPA: Gfo/Idh/MocA family protein, partial [Klebsiella pneumoniae]